MESAQIQPQDLIKLLKDCKNDLGRIEVLKESSSNTATITDQQQLFDLVDTFTWGSGIKNAIDMIAQFTELDSTQHRAVADWIDESTTDIDDYKYICSALKLDEQSVHDECSKTELSDGEKKDLETKLVNNGIKMVSTSQQIKRVKICRKEFEDGTVIETQEIL